MSTDKSSYAAGDTVKVTAPSLPTSRPKWMHSSIVARLEGTTDSSLFDGFFYDAPYTIGTNPKTVTAQKAISKPGTYTVPLY